MCGALTYCHFGLTQVFTGAIPFSGRHSAMAMLAIMQGRRPQRPTHPTLTENLWTLVQRCWDNDPHLRPEISEALRVLLVRSVSHSAGDQQSSLDCFLGCSEDPAWKRLISHTLTTPERVSLITTIFSDNNGVNTVKNISGNDAHALINVMDEVRPHKISLSKCKLIDFDLNPHLVDQALINLEPKISKRCLRFLSRSCGRQTLLPRSLVIPLCYNPTKTPLYHGRFADVWKGQYNGQEVAAKVLRVSSRDDLRRTRRVGCPLPAVCINN